MLVQFHPELQHSTALGVVIQIAMVTPIQMVVGSLLMGQTLAQV
jgi:hypothetical protein